MKPDWSDLFFFLRFSDFSFFITSGPTFRAITINVTQISRKTGTRGELKNKPENNVKNWFQEFPKKKKRKKKSSISFFRECYVTLTSKQKSEDSTTSSTNVDLHSRTGVLLTLDWEIPQDVESQLEHSSITRLLISKKNEQIKKYLVKNWMSFFFFVLQDRNLQNTNWNETC